MSATEAVDQGVREADIEARRKKLRSRKAKIARDQLKIAAGKVRSKSEKAKIEADWKDVNRQLSNLHTASRKNKEPKKSAKELSKDAEGKEMVAKYSDFVGGKDDKSPARLKARVARGKADKAARPAANSKNKRYENQK